MKKNYTIVFPSIVILIVLCAFWGCSSSGDDDGPPLPDGLGDETSISGEQVYNSDATTPYGPLGAVKTVQTDPGNPSSVGTGSTYSAAVAVDSRIETNGTLTLKLPDFASSGVWAEVGSNQLQDMGLQVNPSNVRTVLVGMYGILADSFSLLKTNGTHTAEYIYADRDATVKGVLNDVPGGRNVNLILRKGWNWLITDMSSGSEGELTTGAPDSSYKWVID
ncbi:MAG: hypothetical protein LBK13_11615 [Spirochaetales bacterium]|jgi:hypothetical protein|nr:hypothetical protein [Spirochaetales bacterium]